VVKPIVGIALFAIGAALFLLSAGAIFANHFRKIELERYFYPNKIEWGSYSKGRIDAERKGDIEGLLVAGAVTLVAFAYVFILHKMLGSEPSFWILFFFFLPTGFFPGILMFSGLRQFLWYSRPGPP